MKNELRAAIARACASMGPQGGSYHRRLCAWATYLVGASALTCVPSMPAEAQQQVWVSGTSFQPSISVPNLPIQSVTLPWLKDGNASVTTEGQAMVIDQKTGKVILNWSSFDIGEGYEVRFVQPDGTSLALNRVDENAHPSHILGQLNANGGVYLINPNGILFGPNSQVNVGSLLASTLDVFASTREERSERLEERNELFMTSTIKQAINRGENGIQALSADNDAAGRTILRTASNEQGEGTAEYASAEVGEVGDVWMMPGAQIQSRTLDGVVAVGANVRNDGSIETPDGQALLAAAKDDVYFAFSTDPKLRGLLVEVNQGGTVTNGAAGEITAPRGNVTLAGLAVNQEGRVSATTTVDLNGSIRLIARDTVMQGNTSGSLEPISLLIDQAPQVNGGATTTKGSIRIAQRGGAVTLSEGSVTEVLPELESTATAPDVQPQQLSGVEIFGRSVHLQQNSQVIAPGGEVLIEATANPSQMIRNGNEYQHNVDEDSRIVLNEGSVIDVSGVDDVILPMERNVLEVELRGNELADSPVQRDGLLDGTRVRVDVRTGTPIANIDAVLEAIPRKVGERLTEGGHVQLRSEGTVVQQEGSLIDVSGGKVHYEAGYLDTSMLVSGGRVYEIGSADPNLVYSAVLGSASRYHERWNMTEEFQSSYSGRYGRYEEAYDHGSAAGEIAVTAQAVALAGERRAEVVIGPYQRDPSSLNAPSGGAFDLTLNLQGVQIAPGEILALDIEDLLEENPALAGSERNPLGLEAQALQLAADALKGDGFARYSIESRNHRISVVGDVDLDVGTSLELTAANAIDVLGSIRTAGGDVTLATRDADIRFVPSMTVATNAPIMLGAGVTIDTSALWINDNPQRLDALDLQRSSTPLWIDGGSVTFAAQGDVILGEGSLIDTSGGAWLDAHAELTAGVGGDISLSAVADHPEADRPAQLTLDGELRSHAFERGGELSLTAPSIYITESDPADLERAAGTLVLNPGFFQRGGFSSYNLTATAESATNNQIVSRFVIAGDAEIRPRMQNFDWRTDLQVEGRFAELPTGTNLRDATVVTVLPDYERPAVDLAFALENDADDPDLLPEGTVEPIFTVEEGARIIADPGASVSLLTNTSLFIDGEIDAPAGTIELGLSDTDVSETFHVANVDDVAIWLGANARLSARSAFTAEPDPLGLRRGEVLDAGSIDIDVNRGFIVAEQGAVVDVSADVHTIDAFVRGDRSTPGEYVEQRIAADGGTINLTAAEGILFDGEFRARAATSEGASGGALNVTLDPNRRSLPNPLELEFADFDFSGISLGSREIILEQDGAPVSVVSGLSSRLGQVDAIPDLLNGAAVFDTGELANAGFGAYSFTALNTESLPGTPGGQAGSSPIARVNGIPSVGRIVFDGEVALAAEQSIRLNAPSIAADSGRAVLAAPYLGIGPEAIGAVDGQTNMLQTTADVSGGSGELVFVGASRETLDAGSADASALQEQLLRRSTAELLQAANTPGAGGLVELVGNVSTQGADQVTIASAGDIRTRGVLRGQGDGARFTGGFSTYADFTLQADQIYPTTLSEYVLSVGQRRIGAFSVFNPETNSIETETPTLNEIYDYFAGVAVEGDTISRLLSDNGTPDLADDEYVEKEILSVAETRLGDAYSTLTILPGDGDQPVLSAAGRLILDAPAIDQGGVLKAPLGRIVFNTRVEPSAPEATGSVVLRPGSLTSISAQSQIIPFGEIDGTGALVYRPDSANSGVGVRLFDEAPAKNVLINSASIDMQSGSTVDVSGGGDLQAYQFVPGPGGSRDVVSLENAGDSFAILPLSDPNYAPYDPEIYTDTNADSSGVSKFAYQPGESVYLSGMQGLPEGEYAILPARYALLPGAFLITPVANQQNLQPGYTTQRLDGVPIVSGYYAIANSAAHDAQWSGFAVESVGMVRTRSEYDIRLANEHFTAEGTTTAPSIPNDAGELVLAAQRNLNIEADIASTPGTNGRGSRLDISGDHLAVVRERDPQVDTLQILDEQLSNINVESILLGGRRRDEDGATRITIDAGTVRMGEGTEVTASSVLLAATERVEVMDGAQLTASGEISESGDRALSFDGDGALLRVSVDEQVEFTNDASTGTQGDLVLADGARIAVSDGSVLLFGTHDTNIEGELAIEGGSLNIGAGLVSLGEVGDVDQGLVLTGSDLAALKVDELVLTSSSSVDLYGDVSLDFADVELVTQGLRGIGESGQTASLHAQNQLTLRGFEPVSGDSAPTFSASGAGALNISANRIVLGEGEFGFAGFSEVDLAATTSVFGQGTSRFTASGNTAFDLSTPLITGAGAADTRVQSDGLLNVITLPASAGIVAADDAPLPGLGARFTLAADEVRYAGNAQLNSGQLALEARGDSGRDLVVGAGAVIDVSGTAVSFDGVSAASNGGSVSLRSSSGEVFVEAGSRIDVSGVGGEGGSDAGSLSVSALQGEVQIDGVLLADAGDGARGGSFALEVGQLADFGSVNHQIQTANFTEAFSVRVGSGDLTIGADDTITAQNVALTADAGAISVAGLIDASGSAGGDVALNAGGNVTLLSGGRILAASDAENERGGEVWLGTTSGSVAVNSGALIDVSGETGGTVHLRVPRTQGGLPLSPTDIGDGVAITALSTEVIRGASRVDVEAFKVYGGVSEVNTSLMSNINAETVAFMFVAPTLEQSLFGEFDRNDIFHLQPGIEIRSDGDLTVSQDIDFGEELGGAFDFFGDTPVEFIDTALRYEEQMGSTWRFNEELTRRSFELLNVFGSDYLFDYFANGEAGFLTLRAAGDLNVNASISDGFANEFSFATYALVSTLKDEASGWSYRLVSGAEHSSANLLATGKDGGDIHIAPGVVVRASTGDIDIAVAGDLVLGADATLYTAGRDTGAGAFDEWTELAAVDAFDASLIANATYPIDGGDITIRAGGDIEGGGSSQFFTEWLQRIGDFGSTTTSTDSTIQSIFTGYVPTTWAVVPEDFRQNVATLGGGNINVEAGGDIHGLSASIPTTGKQVGEFVSEDGNPGRVQFTSNEVLVQGGGDLAISAGGDISGGRFYVGRGTGTIQAGGDIGPRDSTDDQGTLLALGEGRFDLYAAGSVEIESIFSPTAIRISALQQGSVSPVQQLQNVQGSFFTYDEAAATAITALSGDIDFSNSPELPGTSVPNVDDANLKSFPSIYPGTLDAVALQGSINIDGEMHLFPSAQGSLSLLAAQNINASRSAVLNISDSDPEALPGALTPLRDPSFQAVSYIDQAFAVTTNADSPSADKLAFHAEIPVHVGDTVPVRLVARDGDIRSLRLISPKQTEVTAGRDIDNVTLEIQHLAPSDTSTVTAGRDVVYQTPREANNELEAGGGGGIEIAGPGRLDVIAGRDVALGTSNGIVSIGNAKNPNLLTTLGYGPESGAELGVFAGLSSAPEYAAFVEAYLTEFAALDGVTTTEELIQLALSTEDSERLIEQVSRITSVDYENEERFDDPLAAAKEAMQSLPIFQQQQIAFRVLAERGNNYAGDLIAFVTSDRFAGDFVAQVEQTTGTTGLDRGGALALMQDMPIEQQHAIALAAFNGAAVDAQRGLILQSYFNEVREGGVEDLTRDPDEPIEDGVLFGLERSYAAIETLFPEENDYEGDISLVFSTIQTQQGGDISLLAPGGGIDVGLAGNAFAIDKDPSQLGIIALRAGHVNGTVHDDIKVNRARVFALDGGDIMLWSSEGDIDAGRGAKTALSIPPPTFNENGSIDVQAAVAGSGIRNSRFTTERAPGSVFLFAPHGVVDAGDAGIGSAGDVIIGAQEIIGADNIDIGGVAVGLPVDTGGLAASLTGVSAASSSATKAAAESADAGQNEQSEEAPLASTAMSWLDVFVVGLGEDTCNQNDIECLKRQRTDE